MIAALLVLLALAPSAHNPQAAHDAHAIVTVVDQTGAVIQNATVTLTALDDPKAVIAPVKTTDKGIATLAGLAPGRYTIGADFPGFQPGLLKDVRIKSGDNKHVVVLTIQGFQDSVNVTRDKQEAASDRKATFGTAMTREQIDALSDDPDEMAQQLQDIAGGDAVIRVDSFEGGRLPPKSQIKSIHITRDNFAAENHYAGGLFIDIITQPGVGPLRTNMNTRLRDGSMSGRPPLEFAQQKGPERTQSYNGGVFGTVIPQKASFSLSLNTSTQFDTPYFNYLTPDGQTVTSLGPRRPRDNRFIYGLFDYAITKDQTLRFNYFDDHSVSKNLGIGGFNELDRAYSTEEGSHTLRIQEAGPLGRRFFINTRTSINWSHSSSSSLFNTPTIQVLDAFTSGGQQQTGGTTSKTVNLQSDLDYVRGINSVRAGVQLDGGSYHSTNSSNYLGTYTFVSLADYLAGTPTSFTKRVGDPNIDYLNLQGGMYLQDDIRLRKNLTLSPGIRYELQTHLSDVNNFGPRFGITYAPGKAGKTTLRVSGGVFYDWLSTGTYEQTLRVDGFRQRELQILDPTYPDPGNLGVISATNRYLLNPNLQMTQFARVSAGIDRALTRMLRVNANYAHTTGENLLRGTDLNPPVNGVRQDPTFGNEVEVLSDARSRQDSVNIGAQINFAAAPSPMMNGMMIMMGPGMPGAANAPRWAWRRVNIFMNAGLGRSLNDSDGAFAIPATGVLADDWGPASNDVRRRVNVSINSSQLKNFNVNLNVNAASGSPYTIRTGTDDNGDLLFTDRPVGVGRNTARGSGFFSVNGFFSYGMQFGKPRALPPGIMITGGGAGGAAITQSAPQSVGRYRLNFNAQIQNLTNHTNLTAYSGVLTSPKFGQPQAISGTRKIDFGIGISF